MNIDKTPFSWAMTIRILGYDVCLLIINLKDMEGTAEGQHQKYMATEEEQKLIKKTIKKK